MSYDTNPANDDATGISPGPTRDEVNEAVLDFNDRWNDSRVEAELTSFWGGDFQIRVHDDGSMVHTFETLWEFTDWATDFADLRDEAYQLDLGEAA